MKNSVESEIREIVGRHLEPGSLISILQEIQKKYRYISPKAVNTLSKVLELSEHKIYGIASFYTQFKFNKPGEHQIKVCMGTACHVKGGEEIMESVERTLNMRLGKTTQNEQFSLERVACMGCCALSPVIAVDKDIYGKLNSTKVPEILKKYGGGRK